MFRSTSHRLSWAIHGQFRYVLYSAIQVNASQPIGEPFNAVDEMDTDYSDEEERQRHLMAVTAL